MSNPPSTYKIRVVGEGRKRLVWWDRRLWWRTYRVGGFDGYRTRGERLPCGELSRRMQWNDRRRGRDSPDA